MSKREKLLESFAQIRKLLEYEGFTLERITGSHHVSRKAATIFVVPVHNNKVKAVYVKRAVEIIQDYEKS